VQRYLWPGTPNQLQTLCVHSTRRPRQTCGSDFALHQYFGYLKFQFPTIAIQRCLRQLFPPPGSLIHVHRSGCPGLEDPVISNSACTPHYRIRKASFVSLQFQRNHAASRHQEWQCCRDLSYIVSAVKSPCAAAPLARTHHAHVQFSPCISHGHTFLDVTPPRANPAHASVLTSTITDRIPPQRSRASCHEGPPTTGASPALTQHTHNPVHA
jgi:hypothetical protein